MIVTAILAHTQSATFGNFGSFAVGVIVVLGAVGTGVRFVGKRLEKRMALAAEEAAKKLAAKHEEERQRDRRDREHLITEVTAVKREVTPNGGETPSVADTVQRIEGTVGSLVESLNRLDAKYQEHVVQDQKIQAALRGGQRRLAEGQTAIRKQLGTDENPPSSVRGTPEAHPAAAAPRKPVKATAAKKVAARRRTTKGT